MSERPYMKLWVGDYICDTRHLTLEQHGAYMLLLMAMWSRGGTLPGDHEQLARIVGLSINKWSKLSPAIMPFFIRDGDTITQNRLAKELKKARKNSESAKSSAEARWLNNKGSPDANAVQTQCYHSHSHKIDSRGAKAPASKKGSQVPKDWTPSETTRSALNAKGFLDAFLDSELEKFRDYHAAKGSVFKDLEAAFRTWMRNAKEFAATRGGARPAGGSILQYTPRPAPRSYREIVAEREAKEQ